MARPPIWTAETRKAVQAQICTALATSSNSLRVICEAPGMPCPDTVRLWRADDPEFAAQYALAREAQAELNADEIIEIADTEFDPNRARVRIDARKWHASKMHRAKFGDQLQLDAAVTVSLTDEQLDARIAQLSGEARTSDAAGGEGAAEAAA